MDLGSLNFEGIENLINSMSQSDIEELSSLAGEFFSDKNKNDRAGDNTNQGVDFETITKIASVMSKLSSMPKDPACELLTALKPMLSPERRHKADEAIKMMQLLSLLPLLGELQ